MKKTIYILFLAMSSLTISCSDWLTIQPKEVMSEDEMFQTKSGFYDALHGVYSKLGSNYGHNGGLMSTTVEHMAAQWDVPANSTEEYIRNHDYVDAGENPFASIFGDQYTFLTNINNILKYLEVQNFLPEEDYKRIRGECLGLRAWLHFDLIRVWGPIPGKNNPGKDYLRYVVDVTYERHPFYSYNDYMQLLRKDLDESERLLEEILPEQNYRLNYWGVMALQARLNWWEKDANKALEYANKIIDYVESEENSMNYALAVQNDVGTGDYTFGKEQLFGIYINFDSSPFQNTNTLYNTVSFLDELYEYSSTDIRALLWEERKQQGQMEPARDIRKYLSGRGSVSIVRLAEIYFIAMQFSDLDRANELYEAFCEARGITYATIETPRQLESVLYKEYRKEFFAEGVMFFYHKWQETLFIPRNPNKCTERSYVLSLPRKEIDVNA